MTYSYTWNVYEYALDGVVLHDVEVVGCSNVVAEAVRRGGKRKQITPSQHKRALVRTETQSLDGYVSMNVYVRYLHWKFRTARVNNVAHHNHCFRQLWPRLEWIMSIVRAEMLWHERCQEHGSPPTTFSDFEEYYRSGPNAGYGIEGGWHPGWRTTRIDPRNGKKGVMRRVDTPSRHHTRADSFA